MARRAWATAAFRTLHLLRATPDEVAAVLPQRARSAGNQDASAMLRSLLHTGDLTRRTAGECAQHVISAELAAGLPAVGWQPAQRDVAGSAADESSRAALGARVLVDTLAEGAHAAIVDANGGGWTPTHLATSSATPQLRLLRGLAFVDALALHAMQHGAHAAAEQVRRFARGSHDGAVTPVRAAECVLGRLSISSGGGSPFQCRQIPLLSYIGISDALACVLMLSA